jgi:hypothetical protein
MTVLELMERTGLTHVTLAKSLLRDAFAEIQQLMPYRTTGTYISVVADQKLYDLPTNMEKLLGVYQKYDSDGKYILIPRVDSITVMEDASSTAADSGEDIIVL